MAQESDNQSNPTVDPRPLSLVDRARTRWIKRLVDFSRRNRLLFFLDLKTGTIDLTSCGKPQLQPFLRATRFVRRFVTIAGAAALASAACIGTSASARNATRGGDSPPETLIVESGPLHLHALLYRPPGPGPFPAVLFNHGSGHASGVGANGVPDHHHPEILGPLFVRHGYAFLYLFRRGDGLSRDQGTGVADEMDRAAAQSQEARNRVQAERIQNEDLIDALAGLAALRARPEIDPRRLAVVGHSFGGSLSVLVAERDSTLRAAVLFSAGGYSYDRSSELRRLLLTAVDRARMPLFFIHARNDYSIAAAESLGAEMARLGKPHQVKIYPPIGRTADEGHDFIHSGVSVWEGDVFAFLDPLMKR